MLAMAGGKGGVCVGGANVKLRQMSDTDDSTIPVPDPLSCCCNLHRHNLSEVKSKCFDFKKRNDDATRRGRYDVCAFCFFPVSLPPLRAHGR